MSGQRQSSVYNVILNSFSSHFSSHFPPRIKIHFGSFAPKAKNRQRLHWNVFDDKISGKVEPDLECLRRRLLEGPTGFPPDPNPAVFLEKTTSPVHYSQGQNRQSFSGGRLHWNVLTINVDHLESVEVSGQRQRFIFQT